MSYLNPLLAFGFDKLASAAGKAGVCGFIIPDLPYDEGEDLRAALAPHGLAIIQMVTPVTQPERMKKLCAATQGFVYAVTMTGTTGRTASVPGEVTRYLDSVTAASKLPVCAGFGIRSHEQVRAAPRSRGRRHRRLGAGRGAGERAGSGRVPEIAAQ